MGEVRFVDAVSFGNFDLEEAGKGMSQFGIGCGVLSFGNYFSAVLDVLGQCPLDVFGHRR